MATQRKFSPYESGLKALLHSFRHAMKDIALAGVMGFALGAIVTEAVGAILMRAWPTLTVHLAAAAIGLLLGYAAAVTLALRDTIRGVVGTLEHIATEIEHLGSRITHEVEEHTGHTEAGGASSQPAQMAPIAATALAGHNGHDVLAMVRPIDGR